MIKHGKRQELIAELTEMAEGWAHLGKDDRAAAAAGAAAGLEAGSFSVKVGHTVYTCGEDSDEQLA